MQVNFQGHQMTLTEWSRQSGLSTSCYYARKRRGMSEFDALHTDAYFPEDDYRRDLHEFITIRFPSEFEELDSGHFFLLNPERYDQDGWPTLNPYLGELMIWSDRPPLFGFRMSIGADDGKSCTFYPWDTDALLLLIELGRRNVLSETDPPITITDDMEPMDFYRLALRLDINVENPAIGSKQCSYTQELYYLLTDPVKYHSLPAADRESCDV